MLNIQTTLLPECLITYFTGIMTLTTIHTLMCYQTALLTQCLIIHFTGILTLTTTYVCVYAVSEHTCHCMPYYKYHKHKGPHHCVFMPYHITLVTVCLITNITNIRVLPTVCVIMLYQGTPVTVCLITKHH